MLSLACEAGTMVKDGYVLFPRKGSDIKIIPRNYYNRYLREVIDNPEFEGKQIVRFYKVSPQEALTSLESFSGPQGIADMPGIRKKIQSLFK